MRVFGGLIRGLLLFGADDLFPSPMSLPGTRKLLLFAMIAICLAAFSGKAVAQIPGPSVSSISPARLSTGETVDITITGRK
jgi:hypothetical protein